LETYLKVAFYTLCFGSLLVIPGITIHVELEIHLLKLVSGDGNELKLILLLTVIYILGLCDLLFSYNVFIINHHCCTDCLCSHSQSSQVKHAMQ
jgi:hypothetical protein